jgi:hypothetical protein
MPEVKLSNHDSAALMERLVGLNLSEFSRACDMAMLGFGEWVPYVPLHGRNKNTQQETREFSLHIQCGWRIVDDEKILAGYLDVVDREDSLKRETPLASDPKTLLDQRFSELRKLPCDSLKVQSVEILDIGDCRIRFGNGMCLEIIPIDSSEDDASEYWRLLTPNGWHLVVSRAGFSKQE